jgi:hypothetical protein
MENKGKVYSILSVHKPLQLHNYRFKRGTR